MGTDINQPPSSGISLCDTGSGQMALLRLMQLTSPSLPVGAFAYSQGLEAAVEVGLLTDRDSAGRWILDIMKNGLARLELPLFYRLYAAWQAGDEATVTRFNTELFAQRETRELRAEDAHMGGALARLLTELNMPEAKVWKGNPKASFTTLFALACVKWQIEVDQAAHGFLWSWLENQVAAAIKLVPLGQTDGQKLIGELLPHIPDLLAKAKTLTDDEIGASLPLLAILSGQHETQYSRLFRS
ncbi:urease accessory protein UreF [Leucothrix mucor]|uniref:urease accessory protein UreF n=1 Tax=Leucothrix mucor TaxID=45248 RepID=UPI0003B5A83F|nr:urease accessory protein UreF [Leucothrix mucor]